MRLLDVSWRFVAGVVIFLLAAGLLYALLSPELPSKGHFDNANYTEYRPGGARCDPTRLGGLKPRQAQIERDRCAESAEEHRLKSEDLVQQTRAADSGDAMVDLTYRQTDMMAAGTAIGFLTLVAAFFAVLYARKAGGEARRAANAAEGQLAEAAKVSAAELRPYVFVDLVEADDTGNVIIPIRIMLRNYGTIPARSMTVKRDCYFTDTVTDIRSNVLSDSGVDFPVCAHGYDRTANAHAILRENQRAAWEAGRLMLVIRVRIRYRGIRRYAERFDYFHTINSIQKGRPFILTAGLREKQERHYADLVQRMSDESGEA